MPVKISDASSDTLRQYITNNSLYVGINVSHAGFINKNNFYYIPELMRDSVGTFIEPYEKPFIKHHDLHAEPIGRVIYSEFRYTNDEYKMFENNTYDYKILVQDTIRRLKTFKTDLKDVNSSIGYIYTIVKISDKDAIDKILSGLYKTVSVSASTNHSVCSICGTDWSTGESCEHEPFRGGVDDEGNPVCFIAGLFDYEEISIVNVPADPYAVIEDIWSEEEVMAYINKKTGGVKMSDKSKNTNIQDSAKDDATKVKDLEKELETLKEKLKEMEDLNKAKDEEIKTLNDANKTLIDELREIYLTKLKDTLVALGKKEEEVTKLIDQYKDKTIEQLKDYISLVSIMTVKDEEDKEDKKEDTKVEDKDKKEDKKDEDEEKPNIDNLEDTKQEFDKNNKTMITDDAKNKHEIDKLSKMASYYAKIGDTIRRDECIAKIKALKNIK